MPRALAVGDGRADRVGEVDDEDFRRLADGVVERLDEDRRDSSGRGRRSACRRSPCSRCRPLPIRGGRVTDGHRRGTGAAKTDREGGLRAGTVAQDLVRVPARDQEITVGLEEQINEDIQRRQPRRGPPCPRKRRSMRGSGRQSYSASSSRTSSHPAGRPWPPARPGRRCPGETKTASPGWPETPAGTPVTPS